MADFWEDIPAWAVVVGVLVAIGGFYFLVVSMGWPMITFWGVLAGVVLGGVVSFFKSLG